MVMQEIRGEIMLKLNNKLDFFQSNVKKTVDALKLKNCTLALEFIHLAMLENDHSPEIHNLLGILSEITGDLILAGKHYRAAYAFDPTYKPSCRNLERITSYFYKLEMDNIDFGDKLYKEKDLRYFIEYGSNNIGHLRKKERIR